MVLCLQLGMIGDLSGHGQPVVSVILMCTGWLRGLGKAGNKCEEAK